MKNEPWMFSHTHYLSLGLDRRRAIFHGPILKEICKFPANLTLPTSITWKSFGSLAILFLADHTIGLGPYGFLSWSGPHSKYGCPLIRYVILMESKIFFTCTTKWMNLVTVSFCFVVLQSLKIFPNASHDDLNGFSNSE